MTQTSLAYLVQNVLGSNNIQLNASEPSTPPDLGACMPTQAQGFDIGELDYFGNKANKNAKAEGKGQEQVHPNPEETVSIYAHTTASCAGAGLGVGGG